MLIAREPATAKKIQVRARIDAKIYAELNHYINWAGISYRDFFIEQACDYIFKHDKDWINYKKGLNSLLFDHDEKS